MKTQGEFGKLGIFLWAEIARSAPSKNRTGTQFRNPSGQGKFPVQDDIRAKLKVEWADA
jgi:hypothetical protein